MAFNLELLPEAAAVNVAQVPVVYQVPPLMIHPVVLPPVVAGRVPFPEKGMPGVEVGGPVVTVVVGGLLPPDPLSKYFTPVAGQDDLEPSTSSQYKEYLKKKKQDWMPTRISGNKFSTLYAPFNVVKVPNLVQLAVSALNCNGMTSGLCESGLNLCRCVCLGGGRYDASHGQKFIRTKGLK